MDKDILEILNEPEAILQRRKLLYGHVSPFRALCMADLMDGMIIPTALDETSITVNVMFGEIFLSSGTSEDVCLLDADLVTRNGVIHKIGEVFLSEFLQTNGFDLLATTAELSKFSFALAMYGLDDMIQNDLLTIIAPIDSAFPDSSAAVAMELNEATSEEERMRALLLYHLIPGLYPTDFLFDFIRLPTALPGSSILHTSFERIDGTRQHNFNFVRALQVDLVSINTVVHTVSQVLSPRTTETIFPSTFFPTETETR